MGRKKGRRRSPFKLKIKREVMVSIASVVLMLLGLLVLISFSNQGQWLTQLNQLLRQNFGVATLIIPFLLIVSGLMLTKLKIRFAKPNVLLGGVLVFIAFMGLLQSGDIGNEIFKNVAALIQPLGAYLLFISTSLIGLMVLTESSLDELIMMLVAVRKRFQKATQILKKPATKSATEEKPSDSRFADDKPKRMKIKGGKPPSEPEKTKTKKPKPKTKKEPDSDLPDESDPAITNVQNEDGSYVLPPLELLKERTGDEADRGDINQNASIIEDTLDSFGIQARVVEVNLGPAVTQYAIEIALGTKLSKITSLQNDLALALAAPTGQIRIEAPIPGKSMVGIEIPNHSPEMVSLKQILSTKSMQKNKSKTAVGLGLNVSGEPVVIDIAKMPHVLIAGSTGSGKSVSINSMITAMLLRSTPDEVKFIMVDPKRVELTGYNGIPHLLTPVIIDAEKVVAALEWAVNEMEKRYKLFSEVGVRNIEGYNELSGFQALPYIIIIIDELADIMLFAPSKVEELITRIAQMARATGIHLLLATQRPSVDVITGLIKANITCRIAFNVSSAVDSRVILDTPGAEKLLGRGDMLYTPPDQAKPQRIQGTYVSDNEIKDILGFIKQHSDKPEYTEEVTTKYAPKTISTPDGLEEELDELFEDAVKVITNYDKASASLLQRRLSIGYARAARILDQLHAAGIVSPQDGSKPREVLIKSAEDYFSSDDT